MLCLLLNPHHSYRFNWLFLKRFWRVLKVAVPGICSWSMLLLVLLILARSAGRQGEVWCYVPQVVRCLGGDPLLHRYVKLIGQVS